MKQLSLVQGGQSAFVRMANARWEELLVTLAREGAPNTVEAAVARMFGRAHACVYPERAR